MTSDIFIYDQIGEGGLLGSGITLKDVQDQLNEKADTVIVHINSPGGDVREGFAIHDFLINSGKKITTIIEGKCYSIATVILLAGENREIQENAELMIHNPWGQIEGDADKIKKYGEWVKESEERVAAFYVEKTGQEREAIEAMMKETTFMAADKAIETNFATAKVEPMKAVALINNKMEISKEDKTWLQQQFAKVEKLFEVKNLEPIKNIMVKLDDETEIFVESEDGTLQGKKVFTVSEGEKTDEAVADGNYTLDDGKKITVSGGTITAVEEVAEDSEEVEALKAQIETLTAENTELKTGTETVQAELDTEKAKVTEVQASLQEIKTKVFGTEPVKKQRKEPIPENAQTVALQNWANQLINDRG